jgi:acetyl esterase/lipase
LLQAEDDPVDPVENSLVYYSALRKAGVPAEMHVYIKGGHAFGLRADRMPCHAMAAARGDVADDDRRAFEVNPFPIGTQVARYIDGYSSA